jgi:hypothetical protein
MEERMVYRLLIPLAHTTHLLTTMAYRFLRLSIVRIFPRAADQAKKAALKRTSVHQILLQGKGVTSLRKIQKSFLIILAP